jgi:hypothetical protein
MPSYAIPWDGIVADGDGPVKAAKPVGSKLSDDPVPALSEYCPGSNVHASTRPIATRGLRWPGQNAPWRVGLVGCTFPRFNTKPGLAPPK